MKLKTLTTRRLHQILPNRMLSLMRQSAITPDQFKLYATQKYFIAKNFVHLLQMSVYQTRQIYDEHLSEVLQSNLDDETGVDKTGKQHKMQTHRYYYQQFLKALEVNIEDPSIQLLPAAKEHQHFLLSLEKAHPLLVCGVILMLERLVPLEYRAVKIARDDLFPEIFLVTEKDASSEILRKKEICHYIDDHIVHDATHHFPMLLKALEKYESQPIALKKICTGIDLIIKHRTRFYDNIVTIWTQNAAISRKTSKLASCLEV